MYNYRIKVEYTNDQDARQQTYEVDGSHDMMIKNAKNPAHSLVKIECSGPITEGPISNIVFKLNP